MSVKVFGMEGAWTDELYKMVASALCFGDSGGISEWISVRSVNVYTGLMILISEK